MTDELTAALGNAEGPALAPPWVFPVQTPFNVRCGACKHVWTAASLPMEMDRVAKLLLGLHCPACGGGPKGIFAAPGDIVSPVPPQRIP